jgi:protoporphyrinogen oxidase
MRNIEQRMQRYPGLSLGGGVLGAVGLPDCIASGETAASRAMEQVQDSSRRSARAAS